MKHGTPPLKRYRDMTLAELKEATKEYDKPDLNPKPLRVPKAIRDADRRIRKGLGGRPKIGRGAKRVLFTVEKGLLADADRTARTLKISRSELIAKGLRMAIAKSRKTA